MAPKVLDRVEFDKKAVAELLDDRVIITNDPNDCTTVAGYCFCL